MHFISEKLDDYVVKHSEEEPRTFGSAHSRNVSENFATPHVEWSLSRARFKCLIKTHST